MYVVISWLNYLTNCLSIKDALNSNSLEEVTWSLNTRLSKPFGLRSPVMICRELLLNIKLAKTEAKH